MFVDLAHIERLISAGRLERVPANPVHAAHLIEHARGHCRGAEAVLEVDAPGAYTLSYEAARKSLTAVLLAQGLRPTTIGGHRVLTVVLTDAAASALSACAGSFERMRRRRNELAYPRAGAHDLHLTDVRDALVIAREVVSACSAALGLDEDRHA